MILKRAASDAHSELMKKTRVILAGGNGCLGKLLTGDLLKRGYEVVLLTRRPVGGIAGAKEIGWDGKNPGPWMEALEGSQVLINLAGRSVDCRYNAANRRAIIASRMDSTRILGTAVQKCRRPPAVWLNSSTATIYKHSFNRPMDESGEIGATPEAKDAFSITVAQAWEAALTERDTPGTRKVALRTAMVLSRNGGVFPVLRRLVRLGLGGSMAGGRQYVSWIYEMDFCEAIAWLISRDDMSGPVNVTAPNPLPNREMMRALRVACGAPVGLRASAWMLEAGAWLLRTETELIIKSRRVVPGRLLASGFKFRFGQIQDAFHELTA